MEANLVEVTGPQVDFSPAADPFVAQLRADNDRLRQQVLTLSARVRLLELAIEAISTIVQRHHKQREDR
jgi:uncharacterized protein YlxW (UPF0749 family)